MIKNLFLKNTFKIITVFVLCFSFLNLHAAISTVQLFPHEDTIEDHYTLLFSLPDGETETVSSVDFSSSCTPSVFSADSHDAVLENNTDLAYNYLIDVSGLGYVNICVEILGSNGTTFYRDLLSLDPNGDPIVPLDENGDPIVDDTQVHLVNPIGVNTIQDFVKKLLDIVLTIGIPIVALAIIYAGFLFVSARGNTEKLETAKETLLYTIIGAAILLGSWVLASAISATITSFQ